MILSGSSWKIWTGRLNAINRATDASDSDGAADAIEGRLIDAEDVDGHQNGPGFSSGRTWESLSDGTRSPGGREIGCRVSSRGSAVATVVELEFVKPTQLDLRRRNGKAKLGIGSSAFSGKCSRIGLLNLAISVAYPECRGHEGHQADLLRHAWLPRPPVAPVRVTI